MVSRKFARKRRGVIGGGRGGGPGRYDERRHRRVDVDGERLTQGLDYAGEGGLRHVGDAGPSTKQTARKNYRAHSRKKRHVVHHPTRPRAMFTCLPTLNGRGMGVGPNRALEGFHKFRMLSDTITTCIRTYNTYIIYFLHQPFKTDRSAANPMPRQKIQTSKSLRGITVKRHYQTVFAYHPDRLVLLGTSQPSASSRSRG